MGTKNKEQEHYFVSGMKRDSLNQIEDPKSYFFGLNGRLYSNNGKFSFSSIEGTIEVLNENRIKKYLGYAAFKDELILFVKVLNTGTFNIDTTSNYDSNISMFPESSGPIESAVDFSDLYSIVDDGFYGQICENEDDDPIGLQTHLDAIISVKKTKNTFSYDFLWVGNMNWKENSKIVTIPIHENNSFKRIYFTDYLNSFRVINILNGKIENLSANRFNVFQSFSLSQPIIKETSEGGALKTAVNFYAYRLLSDDGQRTVFSDLSERVIINPGSTGQDIRGGDTGENTGKKVTLKIINDKTDIYDKIEVIAIIYEAEGSPTSIKSIGVQDLKTVNTFVHSGNESAYDLNVTISDVTKRSGGWRFCSDIKTKKNKLIAAGLRNTPLPFSLLDMDKDFILKAFDVGGSTYNSSFINPNPRVFRFIPKNGGVGTYKKKKTIINEIKAFGSFTLTIKYFSQSFTKSFVFDNVYNNVTFDIWKWLEIIKTDLQDFDFTYLNQNIIISPKTDAFDLDNLLWNFSTDEVTIDADYDYDLPVYNVTSELIHGYQSLGFEKGNGIRITFKPEFQDLMSKQGPFMSPTGDWINNNVYNYNNTDEANALLANSYSFNRSNLFDLKENKFKRGLFKNEIYRLGLQFERSGENLFTIPIGDILVPALGEKVLGLNSSEIVNWVNSREVGDILQSVLANLIIDIRLNCNLKKIYTSLKIVYVQRTVNDRSIVCQGISAPLMRVTPFANDSTIHLDGNIANKWALPYAGGPAIDNDGINDYYQFGENMNYSIGERGRTIVNGRLMYFDSPEILFDRISPDQLTTGRVEVVAKVWSDHLGTKSLGHGFYEENQKTFSQKIHSTMPISGRNAKPDRQFRNPHGLVGDANTLPMWVNVSIMSSSVTYANPIKSKIVKSKIIAKGEILSGSYLDSQFEISNNALALFQPEVFYYTWDRYPDVRQGNTNFEGFKSSKFAVGARTVFIRTKEDIFTKSFFAVNNTIVTDLWNGSPVRDANLSHAIINIVKDNADAIYGGRSELAYSRNVFIPLSKTIAISNKMNETIRIQVQGDTYCSLFFNNKTSYANISASRIHMNHAGGGNDGIDGDQDFDDVNTRTAAWAYGVVLESTVDITLARGLKFYQNSNAVDMRKTTEKINEVYFQEASLKKYITKPINFKDDPDLLHIIAVSDTKIMGSPIDNFTNFKINNFYELEKDKGAVFNLGKNLNDIFSIQENQSSRLFISERNASINTTDGSLYMKTGDGTGIDGHEVISDYGTSIRRSVTQISSSVKGASGFYFYDERKNELVKNTEGIFLKEDLAYYVNTLLKNDKIYDVEGFYDDLNKETVVRTRSKNGLTITYSYNELLSCMNGIFEYDNDQYFMWNNEVFTPKKDSSILEQLNKGPYLRISGDDKILKIGVVTNISPSRVKVFHNFLANINIDYPIDKIIINTSSGQSRTILGTHKAYRIRENVHTSPLKNTSDWADLRGEWMELSIEVKNLKNKKIDIYSITNFVRESTI